MVKHICGGLVTVLASTATVVAAPVTVNDFLIYAGGDVDMAGASLYRGDIGSNADLTIAASETQVLGSVYVVGELGMRAPGEIGSDGLSSFSLESPLGNVPGVYDPLDVTVIANTGDFQNANVLIYGTVDLVGGLTGGTPTVSGATNYTSSADTFGGITLTPTSFAGFATGGPDQLCTTSGCTSIGTAGVPLATNTLATAYGALETASDKDVYLGDGTYYFEDIDTAGDLDLYVDLTNGPVTIHVLEDATFRSDTELYVKGPGSGGGYVLIRDAPELAALINWEIGGTFTLAPGGTGTGGGWGSVFGGYVYSSWLGTGDGVVVGQHIDWYGALWARDSIGLADHSRYTYVPLSTQETIPEPATLLLFGTGLLGVVAARRRVKKRG